MKSFAHLDRKNHNLRTLSVALCAFVALGLSRTVAATTTEPLSQQKVLEAVQRGALGKMPAHIAVKSVQFTETSRVDTEVTIKGDASLTMLEDSYIGVRATGLKRPSGSLMVTVVRLAHKADSVVKAPFQAVVSLLDTAPRIFPQFAAVGDLGKPLNTFKSIVIEGSADHEKLKELEQAFAAAEEKFQRVKTKWENLQKIHEWVGSYDAFVAANTKGPSGMGQTLEKGLDSAALKKTYEAKISSKGKFSNRQQQYEAFVALVQPVLTPEYPRIKEIFDTREAAGSAYVDYLLKH